MYAARATRMGNEHRAGQPYARESAGNMDAQMRSDVIQIVFPAYIRPACCHSNSLSNEILRYYSEFNARFQRHILNGNIFNNRNAMCN